MKFTGFQTWLRNERFLRYLNRFSFLLSLITVFIAIYDLGFKQAEVEEEKLNDYYFVVLLVGIVAILIRYLLFKIKFRLKVRIFDIILGIIFLLLVLFKTEGIIENLPFLEFLNKMKYVYLASLVYFIREFSTVDFKLKGKYLNPAQLFISSFLLTEGLITTSSPFFQLAGVATLL